MLRWNQRYLLKSYLKSSLWIAPLISIPLALVSARMLHWLDMRLEWDLLGFKMAGAKSLLEAFVSATLAFVVFTFGSLLVAIQIASAQMTPRIIATLLLRNDVVKYTVGFLTFTLVFALSAENTLDEDLQQLLILVAILVGILAFGAFFYLIDYASRLLRPITVLTSIGSHGIKVIQTVYPDLSSGAAKESIPRRPATPDRVIGHRGDPGIVLAVKVGWLLDKAEASDGIVEFVPQVGDFVSVDDPLFNLFGGAASLKDDDLRALVAFGSERTMDQDPTFAFRIAVDIALKALSPAINDPTTAVLAIDQLHRMLRAVGRRELRTDEILGKSGKLRVILRTPNWEDFVRLAFREIRLCGSNNLQIARRLRAMLDNLPQTLPDYRHPALLQELSLLDRQISENFIYPEDLALARVGDTQGLGVHEGERTD
jgi:uncharacterized membrane protein